MHATCSSSWEIYWSETLYFSCLDTPSRAAPVCVPPWDTTQRSSSPRFATQHVIAYLPPPACDTPTQHVITAAPSALRFVTHRHDTLSSHLFCAHDVTCHRPPQFAFQPPHMAHFLAACPPPCRNVCRYCRTSPSPLTIILPPRHGSP